MKNHFLNLIPPLLAAMLLLQGCASLTGFQDGRTAGKNNFELTVGLSGMGTPRFKPDEEVELDVPPVYLPVVDLMGTYGVAEQVDVYIKANTFFNFSLGAKVGLLKYSDASPFALAIGGEFGTFGFIPGLANVQAPLYASVHPTEKLSIYLSPRYVYQFYTGAGVGGISYLGGNGGILFGTRNRFGIEFGYYSVGQSDTTLRLFQVGIGGKFVLSGKQ